MAERIKADQVAGPQLGVLRGANMNSLANQFITMTARRYVVRRVIITNPSVSLTTAVGGVFTAPSQGGSAIATNQSLAALVAPTDYIDAVLGPTVATTAFTNAGLYFTLSVAQGAPATADIYIYGDAVEP